MRRINTELLLMLVATLAFYGCGSGKFFNPTEKLLVGVNASAATIDRSQQLTLTATVTNGGASDSSGVTWGNPTCSASSCGTLSSMSGMSTTYHPPASVASILTVTVAATSVKDPTQSGTATFIVAPDPVVSTSTASVPATIGSAYSLQLISGGTPPYSLQVAAPGSVSSASVPLQLVSFPPASDASGTGCASLPSWLSFNTVTGVLNAPKGVPNTATDFVCAVKVSDTSGVTAATVTVSILVPIVINTTALPATEQTQSSYSATLKAEGGSGVFSWSVAGSLPAGLSLNSTTGIISGTVAASATTQKFTIQVAGSANDAVATQSFTIPVTTGLAVVPPSASDLAFSINSTHGFSLQIVPETGAPLFHWKAVSALPSWLSLSDSGTLAANNGVPTTATTSQVTVQVTDGFNIVVPVPLTITVPIILTTTSLPTAEQMQSGYTGTLQAEGGSGVYSWSVSGSLPTGLSLNSSTGVISGNVGAGATTQNFTVQVTDSNTASASGQYAITINQGLAAVTPSAPSLVANIGADYMLALQVATGTGAGPFAWSVAAGSQLPSWLSLSSSGVLSSSSFVPMSALTQSFVAQVKDAANVVITLPLTITVPMIINPSNPPTLPTAEQTEANYSATLTAIGGSGTYPSWNKIAGTLPSGLNLNSSTGLITGSLAGTAASQTFTVQVTDSNGATGSQNYTINVNPVVAVSTTSLPGGAVNTPYSQTLSTVGGVPPYSNWHLASGSLPINVNLDQSTGTISSGSGGIKCPFGTASFSVTVQDSLNITSAPQSLSITTTTTPLAIATTSIPPYSIGVPYNQQLQFSGSGCDSSVTWSIASGSLPAWLGLSSSGVLSGTPGPTDVSSSSFVVQATDGSTTATQAFSLSAIFTVSGQISLANGGGPLQGVTVSLGSNLSAMTDGNGNFNLQVLAGMYTLTPSFTVPSSVFIATSPDIANSNGTFTINVNGNLTDINFTAALGYTVSGKVSYIGKIDPLKLNRVFINLQPTNCNNCSILGTSTLAPFGTPPASSFTIRGVPPGTYTLQAWMDFSGYGIPNAVDPTGTAEPVTVSVATGNVTNAAIATNDPSTPPSVDSVPGPSFTASPIDSGVIIQYQPIMQNGIEQALFYNLQWFAQQDPNQPDASSCKGSTTGLIFNPLTENPIIAGSGRIVILDGNSANPNLQIVSETFPNGPYTFCMEALSFDVTSGRTTASDWSVLNRPVIIGAPNAAGTNTISGNITIPDADPPAGPLYAGCYDVNTGNIYSAALEVGQLQVASQGPNPYSVSGVPTGAACFIFAMLDQDNDGFITPSNPTPFQGGFNDSTSGDIYNTNAHNPTIVAITGNTTQDVDLTPFANNSSSALATQHLQTTSLSGDSQDSYNLNFLITPLIGLPIEVTLLSGPNVVTPADFAICTTCGEVSEFNIPLSSNGVRPQVGDTYMLQVSYSDPGISTDVVTLTVTGVSDNFASSLSPIGSAPSDTPTFSWADPANATSFLYQFLLSDSTGNTIWKIPGQGSFLNFFSSSITSVPWSTSADPTGAQNPPSVTSLTTGATYTWSITVKDINGNLTKTQVNITAP